MRRFIAYVASAAIAASTLVGFGAAPVNAATHVAPSAATALAAPPPPPLDVVGPDIADPPKLTKKQIHKPKGVKGKKGLPGASASGGVSTFAACSPPCYYYAGARRDDAVTPVEGAQVNMGIYAPVQDATGKDSHNLGELAVQKDIGGKMQAVEVGYTVDPLVNAGCIPSPACLDDPHLFVFAWRDGVPQCYNGCRWVDNATVALGAGSNLTSMVGTQRWARIQYFGGNWWIAFDGQWIGYFEGGLWTDANPSPPVTGFTNTTYQQAFGEIAAYDTTTCGNMGNNNMATATTGGRMGSLNKVVAGTASLATYTGSYATVPAKWSFSYLTGSTSSFNYGGHAGC